MKNIFKKLFIPSGTKEVMAYESWIVRWDAARFDGSSLIRTKEECEIFPSKDDADAFADALKNAFQLTKCRNPYISVDKNKNVLTTNPV